MNIKKSLKSLLCLKLYNNIIKRHRYFLTTPIFYVNAQPHIGHLYTAVIADAVARHRKIKTPLVDVKFMTGTDEHGLKIQQAADLNKSTPISYATKVSKMYSDLFENFGVKYTDYLRTTEDRHKSCVENIWNKLLSKGHIYLGEYSGWYCTADEAFVPESMLQQLPDGTQSTIDSNKPVHYIKEQNYMFRLSAFQDDLLHWLKGDVIRPKKWHEVVKEWVHEGSVLEDLSVSRPKKRVSWALSVPNDDSHTVYVWLDALSSYLTSAGHPQSLSVWPPNLQIIGKDILKFHAIYWPAFLIGADISPPERILCHGHWLIDNEKMSKSKGNVVDPLTEAERFTSEGFRYFLLREGVPHNDGNYSSTKIQRILNSELADTLGNLLNRCTGKLVNPQQTVPAYNAEYHEKYCSQAAQNLLEALEGLHHEVDEYYSNYEFYKGINAIISTLHLANAFFEGQKPWELRKNPENVHNLSIVLNLTLETLRICGILLSPIVPKLSDALLSKLNVPVEERNMNHIEPFSWKVTSPTSRQLITENVVLFQRLK